MFHSILKKNSDNFSRLQSAADLCNGGALCLLRGWKCNFKYYLLDLGSISGQSVCGRWQTQWHWGTRYCAATSFIHANTSLTTHRILSQYLTKLMHKICFTISLLYASTCFEHCCVHHQEVKIVLHSIWYHHNCRWPSGAQVEDCAPDGHLQSVTITDAVKYNFDLLMMSTTVLETCRRI